MTFRQKNVGWYFYTMKFSSAILLLIFIALVPVFTTGQERQADHKVNIEIPEVALLGLVSDEASQVNFTVTAPNEAGSPVDFSNASQNNGVWINYTSIIRSQNHRRKVMAMVQGEIPAGVHLFVEASEATGVGKGMLGKPVGKVALSGQATEVISDIGSCFTGKGSSNGHLLSYELEADNSANDFVTLEHSQTTLHVVYTLTDYN